MKVLLLICLLALTACTKESEELRLRVQQSIPVPATMSQVLNRGILYPTAGIQVTGVVRVVQLSSGKQLQIDSFSITPGPDLKVYLSQNALPGNHLNLGNLISNNGHQAYNIPANTNLSAYNYVLIHCQQFNHLFSYGKLQ